MAQIEIKELLPVFTAILGAATALIAVAVSSYYSNRNTRLTLGEQRQIRVDERRLERMEELFVVFSRWQMNIQNLNILALRRNKNEITQEQFFKQATSLEIMEKNDIYRLRMLLALHFASLSEPNDKVEAARQQLVPYLEARLDNQAFIEVQKEFEQACEDFKSAIAELPELNNLPRRKPWGPNVTC
jgi:hypothetical protein